MELTPEQQAEIKFSQRRSARHPTVNCLELEDVLFQPIPVLDHGFVRVIDYMGDDAALYRRLEYLMARELKRSRTMPV